MKGMADTRENVPPKVVAQRLGELLFHFPSGAVDGVQWSLLAQKYEEVHKTSLEVRRLGHSTPLAAATALLWDVLRLIEGEDAQNPRVALDDEVTLVPVPGLLGSWPSLYQALNKNVLAAGDLKPLKDGDRFHPVRSLSLTKLEPLLRREWDFDFDERGVTYLDSETGEPLTLNTFQELVEAVLQWRLKRGAWQTGRGGKISAIDRAIESAMELVDGVDDDGNAAIALQCIQHDVWVDEEYFAPPKPPSLSSFDSPPKREAPPTVAPKVETPISALEPVAPAATQQAEVPKPVAAPVPAKPAVKEEQAAPKPAAEERQSSRNEAASEAKSSTAPPKSDQSTSEAKSSETGTGSVSLGKRQSQDTNRVPKGIVARFRNQYEASKK